MPRTQKTEQLQIRDSAAQKRTIKRQAQRARMSMSEWVLGELLPSAQASFQALVEEIAASAEPSYVFAELLELLDALSPDEFESAVAEAPGARLDAYWQNYLAATVEHAAALKQARIPSWTRDVAPLDEPVFGSSLESLRLHLLINSPPPFLERNIFIDASVGARV